MRIAVATVGTTGDVLPFAGLASALVRAGHEVTAISWELHRDALAGGGVRFVAAGPDTTWSQIRETARLAAEAGSPVAQVAVLRDFHLRDGVSHYRQLRDALAGHDLVVIHGIHSLAEAAARDLGLPWATAVFDPILLPTGEHPPAGMPSLGPLNRAAWWLLGRMLARVGRPLRDLLREAGSPSADEVQLFRGRSPQLHLVACSPTIAGVPGDLPASVTFTGAWMPIGPPAPLDDALARFLDAGPPPAVVSFGSMAIGDPAAVADAVTGALRGAGLRGVVQAGAAGLEPQADDELLPIGHLDHRSLFPRAALVVHHGGAGTTHAAAAAGAPSVVVPHVGDQAFWADRLHRLSAAAEPLDARRLDASSLHDRLIEARSEPIVDGAGQLAGRLRDEDGLAAAVDRLEEVFGAGTSRAA